MRNGSFPIYIFILFLESVCEILLWKLDFPPGQFSFLWVMRSLCPFFLHVSRSQTAKFWTPVGICRYIMIDLALMGSLATERSLFCLFQIYLNVFLH